MVFTYEGILLEDQSSFPANPSPRTQAQYKQENLPK